VVVLNRRKLWQRTEIKEAFPTANVTNGFSIYGHEVRTEKKKVEKWLNGLGF